MDANPITVVLAGDKHIAKGLATAAHSAVATLSPRRELEVYVLDVKIRPEDRPLIERSLESPRVRVHWVDSHGGQPLRAKVEGLPKTWPSITRACYGRLFIPDLLPAHVTRAIYLDCDVLVRRCLGDLFDTDMDGHAAMGVPDVQAPFVSSYAAVPWWYECGRAPTEFYFNSGVMLIDVAAWRREAVTARCLAYLNDGHEFGQDQEAINVVLAGRIGRLDPRWNQQAELHAREWQVIQPYPRHVIDQLLADPWITHYCNKTKPWHYGNAHPRLQEWLDRLDETAYAGWRPQPKPSVDAAPSSGSES